MKIISLTAENVKRLKAVHIEPDGTLQVVTGRNAQGKSSVLDAIWLALGGGAAMRDTAKPVRDGEESASVTLDLGDLVVTRTWKKGATTLDVRNAEGAKFGSPQTMLDALVGRLSFDPLAFTKLSDREQVKALLELVDLDVDLDALAAERERLYDARTEVGRQGKALGDVPAIDDSLPKTEQSASELLAKIQRAHDHNREVEARRNQRTDMEARADAIARQIKALQEELEDVEAQVAEAKAYLKANSGHDTTSLEADLANIEERNAAIRANNAAKERLKAKADLTQQYNKYTEQIEALDNKRDKALAKAKFPVDGLGFTDEGVTYQGVPFSQASAAEQIKVSLAMAMALNPKLKVIRIMDGSLLDADSMKAIAKMAEASDYQVWVERVADGSDVGVVIEDGEVAK